MKRRFSGNSMRWGLSRGRSLDPCVDAYVSVDEDLTACKDLYELWSSYKRNSFGKSEHHCVSTEHIRQFFILPVRTADTVG